MRTRVECPTCRDQTPASGPWRCLRCGGRGMVDVEEDDYEGCQGCDDEGMIEVAGNLVDCPDCVD